MEKVRERLFFVDRLYDRAAALRAQKRTEKQRVLVEELESFGFAGNLYEPGSDSLTAAVDYVEDAMLEIADLGSIQFFFRAYVLKKRGEDDKSPIGIDFPCWPTEFLTDASLRLLVERVVCNVCAEFQKRHQEFVLNGDRKSHMIEYRVDQSSFVIKWKTTI